MSPGDDENKFAASFFREAMMEAGLRVWEREVSCEKLGTGGVGCERVDRIKLKILVVESGVEV